MNSRSVLSNFIWRFLERSGAQIVQLVMSKVKEWLHIDMC